MVMRFFPRIYRTRMWSVRLKLPFKKEPRIYGFDFVIPDPYAPFDPDITVRQARDDILTALSDYLQEC